MLSVEDSPQKKQIYTHIKTVKKGGKNEKILWWVPCDSPFKKKKSDPRLPNAEHPGTKLIHAHTAKVD